jgi:replicative DNA helicase
MTIYSLQVEKHVIAGIFKNKDILCELVNFVSEKDFYNEVHSTIFLVCKNLYLNKQEIDKVLVAQKIKDLGVSFKDEINIFDYVESITFAQLNEKATVEAAKELIKFRVRREMFYTGEKIKNTAQKAGEESLNDFIINCDKIYADKISSIEIDEKPCNLFETIAEKVEDRGNNIKDDTGLVTPYPEFNRLYGGLRPGNIYAIVSRPGQGKTTWINDICLKTSLKNNVKALILDTEMSAEEMQFRMISSISGVPMWYVETGNWRKNADMTKKVREALKKVADYKYYHYRVGSKNIDEICSLVKRWYYKEVGRGNQCIVAYDYVKLTGEKIGQNWAEHQVIGEKIDKLKRLSEEINCPIITAMQMNRSGENFNRKGAAVVDDSSAIALSDRLQWFASFVAIFRRKTVDEIAVDGENFGSHKLVPIKTRFQGKDASGHHDLVKRRNEQGEVAYQNNFLNFNVNSFNVEEKGSLDDIVKLENEQFELKDQEKEDSGTL